MAIKGSALLGCQRYTEATAHVGQGPGCILGWHQKVVFTFVIFNLQSARVDYEAYSKVQKVTGLAVSSRDGISAESS